MTGIDSNRIARATVPFFVCLLAAIALITLFPAIVTSVPDALMGVSR
jgi:TRAP-type C4-dicarboxylate transport system permease large subunit